MLRSQCVPPTGGLEGRYSTDLPQIRAVRSEIRVPESVNTCKTMFIAAIGYPVWPPSSSHAGLSETNKKDRFGNVLFLHRSILLYIPFLRSVRVIANIQKQVPLREPFRTTSSPRWLSPSS